MGAYLSSPQTEKETDRYNDTHFRVGSSSMQGWRQHQEDAHKVILGFGKDREQLPACAGLFTVMDGHGGGDVSAYASTQLESAYSSVNVDENSDDSVYQNIIMGLDANIRQHFTQLASSNNDTSDDNEMQEMLDKELQEAKGTGMTKEKATQLMMKVLYLQQKSKVANNLSDSMGCTCVTSLIIPRTNADGELRYFVKATNSGDSRVLVWNQETDEVHGTRDHKPNDPEEKQRIEHAGGEVREMNAGGDRVQYRVNGNLNLCRALGDFEYKKRDDLSPELQMITSCPDVYSWECKEGDIVVLACDGIFDVKTNRQVIDFVRERINEKDLGTICEECMTDCLAEDPKQSHGIGGDNMTIMVIHLVGTESSESGSWPDNSPTTEETVEPMDT